jgi:hypothetical protein
VLRTRIPRGRSVRRFKFDPLTEGEIETLQSVPSGAAAHLAQCSCSFGDSHAGESRAGLAEIADLLQIALQHGHELVSSVDVAEMWAAVRHPVVRRPGEQADLRTGENRCAQVYRAQ